MLYKFQKTIDLHEKHPRGIKNTSTVHHCTNDDLHTTVQRNEFNLLNKPWLDRSNDPSGQEKMDQINIEKNKLQSANELGELFRCNTKNQYSTS